MKILISATLLFFVGFLPAQELVDKVVAQVGSEYILLSDVEKQFAYLSESQGVIDDEARCDILESLMAQKVMIHQARLDSVIVTPQEIDAQLDYRIESILRQMNGNTDLFEEYYGQTVDEVKVWMRTNMEEMLLAERMQASLFDNITITPSETKEFFELIPQDSLPYFNAEVEVAEIVSVPKVNSEQRQIALDQAIAVRKMIVEDGEPFELIAEKYSSDPGSKRVGGDLGWQVRGTFVPEFEASAYSMEKNEISQPVESDFGFHIIQLLDRRGNSVLTRHVLIAPLITDTDIELAKDKLIEIKQEVLSDSISFNAAIKKYSDKNAESYNNNGRLTNPVNGTTFFETGDLPPDIYFAIEELDLEDISDPIEYLSPTNKTQYRIVKLLSRTKPHKANLKDDYSKIQFYAKENKKNEYFAGWIADKTGKTYVRIEENYKTCPNLDLWLN